MRHFISGGGAQLLLGERGGAASAFAAEAALSFLRVVVQRQCHGPHDIHEDGPGVVATVAEMTVGLQASPAIWPRATVRMGRRDVFKRVCSVFVI